MYCRREGQRGERLQRGFVLAATAAGGGGVGWGVSLRLKSDPRSLIIVLILGQVSCFSVSHMSMKHVI